MSEQYDRYLEEHIHNVNRACRLWVKFLGGDYIKSLGVDNLEDNMFLNHDASKYTGLEYPQYDAYFYGEQTPEVEKEFDYAWLNHIHHNPHHWQYWILHRDDGTVEALKMPGVYIFEMLCDWTAFSIAKQDIGELFEFYMNNKDNMVLHTETRSKVVSALTRLRMATEGREIDWLSF